MTLSRSALTVRQMCRSDFAGTAIASELMNRFAPNCCDEVCRCEVGTGKACPGGGPGHFHFAKAAHHVEAERG